MADVRLGGVEGHGMVPDVLGAEKHPEGEAIQEIPGGKKTSDRAHAKSSFVHKEVGDVLIKRRARREEFRDTVLYVGAETSSMYSL